MSNDYQDSEQIDDSTIEILKPYILNHVDTRVIVERTKIDHYTIYKVKGILEERLQCKLTLNVPYNKSLTKAIYIDKELFRKMEKDKRILARRGITSQVPKRVGGFLTNTEYINFLRNGYCAKSLRCEQHKEGEYHE